jgi:hypothetical protein
MVTIFELKSKRYIIEGRMFNGFWWSIKDKKPKFKLKKDFKKWLVNFYLKRKEK